MKDVKQIVIDASGGTLGRIAAFAAKQALLGKNVTIVNCNNALITGRREEILEKYLVKRRRGSHAMRGPHFPKEPFRLMKRTVRGMLSHKQGRGDAALRRVICFNETPEEFKSVEKHELKRSILAKTISLKELSNTI